jgi:uncharacterized membrane protein
MLKNAYIFLLVLLSFSPQSLAKGGRFSGGRHGGSKTGSRSNGSKNNSPSSPSSQGNQLKKII